MDIISLSKSNKMIKEAKAYHQQFLGEGVEAHFSSLDERLDWLEDQYNNASAKDIYNLLVNDAILYNTEIVNGVLQLKHDTIVHPTQSKDYKAIGYYEKNFDLSSSFIETLAIISLTTVASKQNVKIEFSTSPDGVTYSGYSLYDPANLPNERFVKVKITLESTDLIQIIFDANMALEENPNIKDGELLKEEKMAMLLDTNWSEEGSLHRKKIARDEWLRIDKMNVLINK